MPGLHSCAAEVCDAFDLRITSEGNQVVRKTCNRGWSEQCFDIAGKWKSSAGNYDIEKFGQVYRMVLHRSDKGDATKWKLFLPCPDGVYRTWGGLYPEPWEIEIHSGLSRGRRNSITIKRKVCDQEIWSVEAWPETDNGVINLVSLRRLEFALRSLKNSEDWFDHRAKDEEGKFTKAQIATALRGCGLVYNDEWDENHDGEVSKDEFLQEGGMRDKILEYVRSHLD